MTTSLAAPALADLAGLAVWVAGPADLVEQAVAALDDLDAEPMYAGALLLALGGTNDDPDAVAGELAMARTEAVADAAAVIALPGWTECPHAASDVALAQILGVPVWETEL